MRTRVVLIVAALGINLAVVIAGLVVTLSRIQIARERSGRDTCYLLRGLVETATPANRLASARAYVKRTPLRDCNHYGRLVRDGKTVRFPLP